MNWKDEDIEKLKTLRNKDKKSFSTIAKKLNRSVGSCRSRYWREQEKVEKPKAKMFTEEQINKNRAILLGGKKIIVPKKASLYLIYFPHTLEMKVGVSNNVHVRRSQYGYNITEIVYESLQRDRYIVKFIEGYILSKFKANSEIFKYDINDIDNLIEEIESLTESLLRIINT